LDFCPRTAFIIRIYEKIVIFGKSNPKFGAKRADTLDINIYDDDFGLHCLFVLNPARLNPESVNSYLYVLNYIFASFH